MALVEEGNRDGRVSDGCGCYLKEMSERIRATKADTLILGCTHFSHLEGEIGALLPEIKIVSPARVGAEELIKRIKSSRENGKITYV